MIISRDIDDHTTIWLDVRHNWQHLARKSSLRCYLSFVTNSKQKKKTLMDSFHRYKYFSKQFWCPLDGTTEFSISIFIRFYFKKYFGVKMLFKIQVSYILKVVSATFVLVYFLNLNESTCQTKKNVFYFSSKAFFVLEKINFRNQHFQISWRHQMPKHKTANTFNWIIWGVNTIC